MHQIIIIAACILLNGLLAAYEMAFVSVSKAELRRLSKDGNHDAQRLLTLRQHPERTLSVLQIGISLVGAVSAAVGGAGASEKLEPYFIQMYGWSTSWASIISILIIVLPLTYLSVVVGELVPKTLALRHSMKISLFGSRGILIADRVFHPAVAILEKSTKFLLSIFFPRSSNQPATQTEAIEVQVLSQSHRQHVLNLAQLETKKIKHMIVEWKYVNTVDTSQSVTEVTHTVFTSGHTRLPVMDNGQVRGILHTKEFLVLRESGNSDWKSIIRPILKVLDVNTALEVLKRMQVSQSHMAVVYTSQQERLGIVTLEDINEEIWGAIYDEDDDNRLKKLYTATTKRRILSHSE